MDNREEWLRFRAVLRAAIKRRGLSLSEMASTAEVRPTDLSAYLNHGIFPSVPNLHRLARALDLKPEDIISGTSKTVPPEWEG